MSRHLLPIALLFIAASCRMVNQGGNSRDGIDAPCPTASPFKAVDSLIQCGFQDQAVRLLRGMDQARYRNDILWRLVGTANGRGRLEEGLSMLDSLERNGWGDLAGWKISLLDLNRETARAENLAGTSDVLLAAWLCRDSLDDFRPGGVIPVPGHLGERAARLLLAPDGITPGQLELAATDAGYLPVTIGPRVQMELELSAGSSGTWWDDALKIFDPDMTSDEYRSLQALRMRKLNAGDYGFWRGMQGSSGWSTAAMVIASRWPEFLDWDATDALFDQGYGSIPTAVAASRGDPVFSAGVRMAFLRDASRYSELMALCDSLPAETPVELLARAALFRARALRGLGRNTEAYSAYSAFAGNYPWHPTAREAAYLAGKYFDSEQNWGEAADAYLASLGSAGSWDGDSRGHWRGGFCLYMNGRGAVGDSLWEAGCESYPFSHWRDEMLFWRARYAERQGNRSLRDRLLEQAAREHPWEYYGMLAAERLGMPYQVELPVVSPVLGDDPVLTLAAELFSLGYGTAAVEMLAYGRRGDRGRNAVALGLMGEHGLSISLMRRMDTEYRDEGRGILPDSLLGWYFPDPYRELVFEVTDTMTLDPSYVRGIMREESYFNRFVISSAGAAGLIQLMPSTASDVARWNGLPRLSPEEFFLPEHSVLYGSLYINSQARRYSHPAVFLAAYNAGPGNASRWIDMHGFDPEDQELYIEQITYRETRLYAKKVQRSAWIYGRIRQ